MCVCVCVYHLPNLSWLFTAPGYYCNMTPKDIWALNVLALRPGDTRDLLLQSALPAPQHQGLLTISKFSKFGKAVEGDPSLGSEYYTTIPWLTEDMVVLDYLL